MKKLLILTAALIVAFAVAPTNAEPGPSDGVWALDNVQNCKVPSKVYWITTQNEHFPTRFRFDNVATGSYDIEEFVAAGDGSLMTTTIQSVRANGGHGHAVGTQWEYHTTTSDLINVESNGKHAYWIVKCDDGSAKTSQKTAQASVT